MHGEALTPAAGSEHHHAQAVTKPATPAPAENHSPETQTVTATAQVQARKQSATRTVSTVAQTSAPKTISATATAGSSGDVHTQQLTKTLRTANGPPAQTANPQANPNVGATDFVTYIQQFLAGKSASFTQHVDVAGSLSVGGFLQLNTVGLDFAATLTNGTWSGSVTVSATSGSIFSGQNFSATVGSVSGTYIIGTVPQGSHAFSLTVHTLSLNIGQALNISAPLLTVTYDPGAGTAQTVATIASATASSPLFSGLPTATLTNFKLRPNGFSFDDFTLKSTSPITIGSFFKATGTTSLSVSDFDLSFNDPTNSTAIVGFTADNIQLFPGVGFLNLNFAGLHGTFDIIDTSTVNNVSTSVVGSGIFSLGISSFDISVGEAFTIHLGDVIVQPGQATIASVGSATITSNLLSGFGTFDLGTFDLTQHGFTLSTFSFTPVGTTVSIGTFASFSAPTLSVTNFKLNDLTVSGSVTFSGGLTLFPGNANFSTSFTNLQAKFDFSSIGKTGSLSFTADSFTLSVDSQLEIDASGITITPDQTTILHIDTASVTLAQLNGLTGTINNLDITNTGFTIDSANFTASNLNFDLGGLVSFSAAPSVTLTKVSYTAGGTLGGTVTLDPTTVTLTLGSATASGTFSGDYNIKTGTLNAKLDSFSLNLAGFVSVTGSGLVVLYQPSTDGSAAYYIGGTGLTVLLGSGSGVNAVGVEVTNASFALAIFKAIPSSGGAVTYAFDATGGIAIVGLPTNTISFSAANVEVRSNNAGAVDQFVDVDSTPADAMHLFFTGNETSFMASGLTLNVASLVTITGDFGFQTFTDPTSGLNDVAIAASNVTAVLGTASTNLTISGASLGLLILPGTTNTYALVANGGTDMLNGVPGLSLSANGLSVKVNTTGLDPEALSSLPTTVLTPDGAVAFDFTGLGAGNVIAVEGSISLNIAGFISLQGDFGFQTFTDSNSSKDIIIGAQNISATLGTATTNLTIDGASLQVVIVPGATGGYALLVNGGTDTLNGVPGLQLSSSNLSVKINTLGVDPTTLGLPTTIPTPAGDITVDLGSVGAVNIKDIEGDLTMTVANFVTLHGSFGFQAFKDSTTGLTDIAIGATGITATLGTSSVNLQVDGASLGVVIIAGANGAPSTYALVANGGTDTLNGIPGLSFVGNGLTVKINKLGTDPASLPGMPTAVHTSGGDVTLDFSGIGAGALMDVEGTITLSILNFVTLHGSFAFQSFTDLVSGQSDLAVAATNLDVTMAVGGVTLAINGASLGLVIIPGTGATGSYALVANGGTDSLTGVPGLTLSASGLSVKINNTGVDLTTRIGATTIKTPEGSVSLDFSGLGTGNVKDIEGSITLSILNFVSLSGDFGFQQFTDSGSGTNLILVGAKNVNATLGTDTVNVSIQGASMGLVLLPGTVGNPGKYALIANGGTDALNGVPGLTLSASGLTVKVNNGVSADLLTGAAQVVHTSGGDVAMDFTGLGAGNVIDVEGTVTLNIAGFVSLTGSFVFTKQTSPTDSNVAEIVVGATGINAFIGTADQSVGVSINDANLGLVIYQNTLSHTTTYALHASAGVQVVGLPTDIGFSGTLGLDVNTTGAAVTESVVTPGGTVNINFTDGTNGSADQRNIQIFSGHLTLRIGSQANPLFTLDGDFGFTKAVVSGSTQLLIGATNISTSNIIPDNNGGASVSLTGGTLGLVIFTKANGASSANAGYALTASATVSAGGGGSSGSLTVTIRRNTTTSAVNQTVTAGGGTVQVTFASNEVAKNGTAFQKIALSNASLSIDNTLIITASSGSSSSSGGVTTQTLTGVTLILQDPTTGTVLFSISADSASYSTVNAGATFDGFKWVKGGKDVVLNNISLSIGGYVTFSGSVDIQHYTNATNAVITAFNFTNAGVTFLVNGKPMVSVAGNFAFSYSSATGFALSTATITDFSFLGQSLGGGSVSGAISPMAGPTTTHMLGPITLGTPSISLAGFSLHLDGTLSVKVTISDTLATINGSVISVQAKNLSGSFDIGLQLNLANPLSAPTNITASGFTLKIGEIDITLSVASNISLVLTALNVTIDPTAGPTANLVSFGGTTTAPGLSATLTVAGLSFTGGASNFAITGDGSFVAGNNFSVTLGFGAGTDSGSLQWPSWLPIKDVTITLSWPGNNFNTDPSRFVIDLSASVDLSNIGGIPLTIQGTAQHVIIDVSKLAAGEFPITSIGALGVTVEGNLFGGTVKGTLLAGIVRFDSTGAVVDANGNLVSNGQPGTGTIRSVFYGGIDAAFSLGAMKGFEIRIGLTQYGPLSVYVEAGLPVLLDPISGISITNFRGGVTFGQGLPTINLSNPISATDALQLRQPGFSTPDQLTLEQWQAQLASQVAKLYKDGNNTDGWSNLGASTITFQAGATLYDSYATQNAFKIDADILFDTSGKFLVIGTATFANSLTLGVKMFADLSPVFNGTESTNPVNILFLMDFPAQSSTTITTTPILSIYGVMQFKFPNGGFEIDIAGEADLNVMGGFKASLSGNMALTFSATSFQLTVTNISLNVSYLGEIGTGAGSLTIQKDGNSLDIWGAFLLNANLQALENVGIHAGGQVYLQLNTTTQVQPVTLHLTTGDVNLSLQPTSFSFYMSASATFDLDGTQVFKITGALAVNLNIDTTTTTPTFTLTIFVGNCSLILGPANSPLFNYTVNGLIYVDQNGFAAKMTLTYAGSPLTGFTIGENWLLVMNTTGENISYRIPDAIPTPGAQNIPTVTGPDFSSSNVLATISYETIVNGHRTLSIPEGAPPTGTTNFVTWTATNSNPYLMILGRGNLTVGSLTISGTLNVLASYSPVTGLSFSLQANAKLNLAVNGTSLFSFTVTGFIQINNKGLVAALTITRSAGTSLPSGMGFTLTATFTLEINTTGTAVTVPGTSITVAPGALVAASGTLAIPGFSISGEFDLTVSTTSLTVYVRATVSVLGITLNVQGFAGIYYDNDPGFVLNLSLTLGSSTNCTFYPVASLGNQFVIQGSLTLQINTCSQSRNGVASGFVIAVPSVSVYLFGLNLTGSAYFGITSGGLNIHLKLGLDFFFCHFDFDGYVNSNGTFSITASASFEYDWSIKIFSGEVYAYFTVTLSNTGFSASAGCGVHVDHIGSLSAHASVYISGSEFKMDVGVDIGICDVTVTIDFGKKADPPAPPPSPVLATQTGGVLVLNFGQDVSARGATFGALSEENYVLTNPSGTNGTVVVTALGYTATFTGVTSIVVHNTLGGNDTVTISNQISAAVSITLGDGNNHITTGAGYATINDYGNGSNTINVGSGGGIYNGGLESGTAAYASKGETAIYASNNFTVVESGYSAYILSTSVLQYGSYILDLSGVNTVTLNAPSGNGAHVFTMAGWVGTVNINGQGATNTINVNPYGGSAAAQFVLTNTLLQVTIGGVTTNYNLSDIQTANLTGNAKGANTYTVTGWTGGGSITGPKGSTNTVVAVNDRNFTLTDTSLARSGLPTLTLQNIQNATLTGGASANVFTVQNWSGNATLNGIGGNETFNITFTGVGSGTVTLSDNATTSNDVLNLYTGASTTITSSQLKVGAQLVNYSSIKTLNINGTLAGLTYNIQSTNGGTTTTITSTGAGNVFNISSTAGVSSVQTGTLNGIAGVLVLVGGGSDVLNVDDSGNSTGRTGILSPSTLNFTGLASITYSGISGITISLGQGNDSFTIVDTITSASSVPVVVINGNGGDDTFNVLTTHAVTTINGGAGNDTFWIFANASTLNLNGDANDDTFNVLASVVSGSYLTNALVNVDGGAGTEALNIFGTVLNDSILINGTTFVNVGLNVAFSNITNWTVYGLGGNDTFYVQTVVVTTMLVGDGSVPTFVLPSGVNAPDLTGGATATSFDDTFYIGWQGASAPGSLGGIAASLTIQGNEGTNAAYVDDSANTVGQTFTLTTTTMNSTAMGDSGQIAYSGLATLNVLFGSGNDSLVINDMSSTTATTIDGAAGNDDATLNFTSDFAGTSLTLLNFETASLTIAGNFSGTLTNAGAFTTVHVGGSMTSTGVFNAGSIGTMTLGGDLAGQVNVTGAIGTLTVGGAVASTGVINADSVGGMTVGNDFAGLLNVTNLLDTLAIGGGSPGKIVAGAVNFITVQSGYGNKVLQVIEGGIERQIQASPVAGGTLDSAIRFAFIYDSSGAGNPQLAMTITNNGVVVPHSFNVAITAIGSNAHFDLALVNATAATGLSNLMISGDILFAPNAAELNFLQLGAGVGAGVGVVLPFDNITGVEVSGILPIGVINVAGIEGVAFGILQNSKGQVVPILGDLGSKGKPQVLWNLLGSNATLLAATDAMTVTFNENHSVEVFAQCNTDFTFEYVMTLTDEVSDGAPINAAIQIAPGKKPAISNISLSGDGAGIDSRYDVANITSRGSIGDVTVRGAVGLGNLTASGVFGSINVVSGAITGTIQTTGVRIDPVTGDQTAVSADIGQFTYDKFGAINGVTVISAKLGISGQIISRGNLVSSLSAKGFTGVIAAQGNIGVLVNSPVSPNVVGPASPLTRFGGINISGNDSGQIIALGNVLGDITVTGTLSGRIAVQGQAISGLASGRDGILGNVRIGKFASSAAIVSGGMIGDAAGGTGFKGNVKSGFLAADGDIVLAKGAKVSAANLLADLSSTSNGASLDAIFTDNLEPLYFDTGGDLVGLGRIELDLSSLMLANGSLSGTIQ